MRLSYYSNRELKYRRRVATHPRHPEASATESRHALALVAAPEGRKKQQKKLLRKRGGSFPP